MILTKKLSVHTAAPDTEVDVRGHTDLPRVDIAYSYAGADRAAIEAFIAAGARAIVSASLPPGVTTPAETDALRRGVLVVLSSRSGSGRVLPRATLRAQGFVVADKLNPQSPGSSSRRAAPRTSSSSRPSRVARRTGWTSRVLPPGSTTD